MASPRKKLGELLVEARAIDQMQLQAALGHQRQWGGRLGTVLVQRGFITEAKLVEALATQLRVPVVNLATARVDTRALALVPVAIAEQLRLFPLEVKGSDKSETIVVAMSDPTDLASIDSLQFKTRKRIQPVLAGERDIQGAIRRHYHNDEAPVPAEAAQRPRAATPAAPAPAGDDPFADSHLLSGEDDVVPGLVAWGGAEVKKAATAAGAAAVAAPPAAPFVPGGVPPGFGASDRNAGRGRPMPAPAGARLPAPAPAPSIELDLDPFAELEGDVSEPLLEHVDVVADTDDDLDGLPDPLAGTSPDSWKTGAREPSLGADAIEVAAVEELEELEVDVEELDTATPSDAELEAPTESAASGGWADEEVSVDESGWDAPLEAVPENAPVAAPEPGAVDALAEGWLTPTEESVATAQAAWDAPAEAPVAPAAPAAVEDAWSDAASVEGEWGVAPESPDEAPGANDWAAAPVEAVVHVPTPAPDEDWVIAEEPPADTEAAPAEAPAIADEPTSWEASGEGDAWSDAPVSESPAAEANASEWLATDGGAQEWSEPSAETPAAPAIEASADESGWLASGESEQEWAEPAAETPAAPSIEASADESGWLAAGESEQEWAEPAAETPAAPAIEASADESGWLASGESAQEWAEPAAETPAAPAIEASADESGWLASGESEQEWAEPAAETPAAPPIEASADESGWLASGESAHEWAEPAAETPAAPAIEASADESGWLASGESEHEWAEPAAETPAAPASEASADESGWLSAEEPAHEWAGTTDAAPAEAPAAEWVAEDAAAWNEAPESPEGAPSADATPDGWLSAEATDESAAGEWAAQGETSPAEWAAESAPAAPEAGWSDHAIEGTVPVDAAADDAELSVADAVNAELAEAEPVADWIERPEAGAPGANDWSDVAVEAPIAAVADEGDAADSWLQPVAAAVPGDEAPAAESSGGWTDAASEDASPEQWIEHGQRLPEGHATAIELPAAESEDTSWLQPVGDPVGNEPAGRTWSDSELLETTAEPAAPIEPEPTPVVEHAASEWAGGEDAWGEPSEEIASAAPSTALAPEPEWSDAGELPLEADAELAPEPPSEEPLVAESAAIDEQTLAPADEESLSAWAGVEETQTLAEPEPAHEEPAFAETNFEAPVHEALAVEEPALAEPAYEEPAYAEPAYAEPAYAEPAYEEPALEDPAHEEPAYEGPAYEEPAHEEPAYEEPSHEEPAHEADPHEDAAPESSAHAIEAAPQLEGDGSAAAWAAGDEGEWAGFGDAPGPELAPAPAGAVESAHELTEPFDGEAAAWAAGEVADDSEPVPEAHDVVPLEPIAPVAEPARAEAAPAWIRGWERLGLAHPTHDDAVRVVGALVELLASKGVVDVASLASALGEREEQARE